MGVGLHLLMKIQHYAVCVITEVRCLFAPSTSMCKIASSSKTIRYGSRNHRTKFHAFILK